MIINLNRPKLEIELRVDESNPVIINVYTDNRAIYKAISSGYERLRHLDEKKNELLSAETSTDKLALEVCKVITEYAEIANDLIRMALEPAEYIKIKEIMDYLPVSTLTQIVSAIANGMGEEALKKFSEGKI